MPKRSCLTADLPLGRGGPLGHLQDLGRDNAWLLFRRHLVVDEAARAKLGLSQSEAAAEWGINTRTLQQWEQDQQTPKGFALTALMEKLDAILTPPRANPAGPKSGKGSGPGTKRK